MNKNKLFLVVFVINFLTISTSFADECGYNLDKNEFGYKLNKECIKAIDPEKEDNVVLKTNPYKIINNFKNYGDDEISDELVDESILVEKEVVKKEPEKKAVEKKDTVFVDAVEVITDEAPVEVKEKEEVKPDVVDPENSEVIIKIEESTPLSDTEKKTTEDKTLTLFSKKFDVKKNVELSVGYFKLDAIDLRTKGILNVKGGSNRLNYNHSLVNDKWDFTFGLGADYLMLDPKNSFRILSSSKLLVGASMHAGYTNNQDRFGAGLIKKQHAVVGRFARDPKRDVTLTSIDTLGSSFFYEHNFEELFLSKFEFVYLFGGTNEHYKMTSGRIIKVDTERTVFRKNNIPINAGLVFEGSTYSTDGVDNKDLRVMGKIGIDW